MSEPEDRLRAARIQAGLTQAALARRLGVSPNTVARWERGETAPRILPLRRAVERFIAATNPSIRHQ